MMTTAKESAMATGEDYQKYFCALGSRSVRRVAAKLYAAAELDAEVRIAMLKELTQAVTWQQMAAVSGWPLDWAEENGTGCRAQRPAIPPAGMKTSRHHVGQLPPQSRVG